MNIGQNMDDEESGCDMGILRLSRRVVLARLVPAIATSFAVLPLIGCGESSRKKGGSKKKATGLACGNPQKLSESQISLRQSLGYRKTSEISGQTCAQCAFFQATADGSCGTCEMFAGGPVDSNGYCISWSGRS